MVVKVVLVLLTFLEAYLTLVAVAVALVVLVLKKHLMVVLVLF